MGFFQEAHKFLIDHRTVPTIPERQYDENGGEGCMSLRMAAINSDITRDTWLKITTVSGHSEIYRFGSARLLGEAVCCQFFNDFSTDEEKSCFIEGKTIDNWRPLKLPYPGDAFYFNQDGSCKGLMGTSLANAYFLGKLDRGNHIRLDYAHKGVKAEYVGILVEIKGDGRLLKFVDPDNKAKIFSVPGIRIKEWNSTGEVTNLGDFSTQPTITREIEP